MTEPRLDQVDLDTWSRLMILAQYHAKTRQFSRAVGNARRIIERCLSASTAPVLMWSGGKDSTAMTHLVVSTMGIPMPSVSEKDNLDYPGEVEYVTGLAESWGAELRIVSPDISPQQWITNNLASLQVSQDFHSRAAGMSKACFYGVVEAASVGNDAILLGLRADESDARTANRASHGTMYRKRNGKLVCCPLSDWTGLDVFAYLESNGIAPFSVYRCVGFMHQREPWRIRKSWWLPGTQSQRGSISWLRRYYPSLYRKLTEWFERAQSYC